MAHSHVWASVGLGERFSAVEKDFWRHAISATQRARLAAQYAHDNLDSWLGDVHAYATRAAAAAEATPTSGSSPTDATASGQGGGNEPPNRSGPPPADGVA